MKKIIFLITALLISFSSYAEEDLVESYTARLSSRDHYNSDGQRLDSVAAVIRQDRANYHKYFLRDSEDTADTLFANKDNRARLESMLNKGFITEDAKQQILHGTPLIEVKVYDSYINVNIINANSSPNSSTWK